MGATVPAMAAPSPRIPHRHAFRGRPRALRFHTFSSLAILHLRSDSQSQRLISDTPNSAMLAQLEALHPSDGVRAGLALGCGRPPAHVSLYMLELHADTKFGRMAAEGALPSRGFGTGVAAPGGARVCALESTGVGQSVGPVAKRRMGPDRTRANTHIRARSSTSWRAFVARPCGTTSRTRPIGTESA